jgi:heat shock protein beta
LVAAEQEEDVAISSPSIPVEDTYKAPEDAEKFVFEAEVSRMLDIVINSLYQNKDIFLRELISNASDALDKIRFLSLTKPDYLAVEEKLQVQIEFDSDANTLTVRDTGIGMTHGDMVSNLGTVARSGTTRFMQALKEQGGDSSTTSGDISQIGQFGVGFYSSFLVSDRVQVASKHPDSVDQYIWTTTNGANDFQIFKDPRGNTLTRGTEVTLFLKEDCMEYAAQKKLEQLAKHYSEFVVHPIYLQTFETVTVEVEDEDDEEDAEKPEEDDADDEDLEVGDEEDVEEKPKQTKEVTTMEWDHLNKNPAIWTRSKEDIEDEEYNNFYQIVTKDDFMEPERWTHFQAEGNINFKSILYLPKDIPKSWKDGMTGAESGGLSLYVQKVLISDQFELLPRYLGFMRGVVDSDDLPLNVNRESLQESKIIQVIKKKVVRKALEMIRNFVKEADEEAVRNGLEMLEDSFKEGEEEKDEKTAPQVNKYNDWLIKFAPALKMGAMEDEPNRGKIMKLLRYKTTKANDATSWTSLEKYVENMKDWQKEIYFVAGVDQVQVEKSQFLEQFRAKDVEVIYFTDPIDEYMSSNIGSYEGKKFKNVATDNVDLKGGEEDEDLATRREKYYKDQFKPLTKWLKKLYGMSVMRVAVSKRLVSTPAIASSAEFGHSANMERIMRAQAYSHGQDDFAMRSMKIFELNPRHPLVLKLLEGAPPEEDADDFKVDPQIEDAAWILHEMALLNGGFPLSDPEAHTRRMMRFMQSQLGVESMALVPEPDLTVVEDEPPELMEMEMDLDDDDDDGPKGTSPEDAIPLTPDADGNLNMEL